MVGLQEAIILHNYRVRYKQQTVILTAHEKLWEGFQADLLPLAS